MKNPNAKSPNAREISKPNASTIGVFPPEISLVLGVLGFVI
jgi:hypothetical protein